MGAPFNIPEPADLADVRRELEALIVMADIEASVRWASVARQRDGQRSLERAAELGAAMLDALDLSPVVLDAMDAAIGALDALDGDADIEDGHDDEFTGDDELSLGWREGVAQLDLGLGNDDGEPTLGAPERSPYAPPMSASFYKPANGQRLQRCFVTRAWNQVEWSAGANVDGEGDSEPGYDLPEGDDELCGSEHDGCEPEEGEDSLGSAIGDGDQRHWAQGLPGEREADPVDGPGLALTVEQRRAARDRWPVLHDLARRARAMRQRQARDPDTVTPIAPGMVSWGGPSPRGLCNVTPYAGRVIVVGEAAT